jgi:YD repeat-containing protein
MEYDYDCLGNRTLEKMRIGGGVHKETRYVYDAAGRLVLEKDALGADIRRYECDPCGRLVASPKVVVEIRAKL